MNSNRGKPAAFLLAMVCFPVAWFYAAEGAWGRGTSLKATAMAAQAALLVGGTMTLEATIANYLLMNLLVLGMVAVSGLWGLLVRLVDVPSSHAHVLNLLSILLCILLLMNTSDLTIRSFTLDRAMPIMVGVAVYFLVTEILIAVQRLPDTMLLSFGDAAFSVSSASSKKYLAVIGALIVVLAL